MTELEHKALMALISEYHRYIAGYSLQPGNPLNPAIPAMILHFTEDIPPEVRALFASLETKLAND